MALRRIQAKSHPKLLLNPSEYYTYNCTFTFLFNQNEKIGHYINSGYTKEDF
jgi:hypothetical protein